MKRNIDEVEDKQVVIMGVVFMILSIVSQSLAPIILFAIFVYCDVNIMIDDSATPSHASGEGDQMTTDSE